MNSGSSWQVSIPECPPSANVLIRTHYRERAELKEKFCYLIYQAFFKTSITRAEGKRKVRLILTSKLQRDYANAFLGADKLILDNLVALGYLKDDSTKWMDLELVAETGTPGSIIEISEVLG